MSEWLFTINNQIREREGAEGVSKILAILRAGADAAPHADVHSIEAVLEEASRQHDRPMAAGEIHAIAGNLAVADLTDIHVVDEAGRDIDQIWVNRIQDTNSSAQSGDDGSHRATTQPR